MTEIPFSVQLMVPQQLDSIQPQLCRPTLTPLLFPTMFRWKVHEEEFFSEYLAERMQ